MIVTLSGTPGAGKDEIGRLLASRLSFKLYSIGQMRKEMALQSGMSLEELDVNEDAWTDQEIDDFQEELGATMDNIVVVSRIGFYFIPNAFKIFLKCSLEAAAARLAGTEQDATETRSELERMQIADEKRYRKYYGLKIDEIRHYDLVLDVSSMSHERAARVLCAALDAWRRHP